MKRKCLLVWYILKVQLYFSLLMFGHNLCNILRVTVMNGVFFHCWSLVKVCESSLRLITIKRYYGRQVSEYLPFKEFGIFEINFIQCIK